MRRFLLSLVLAVAVAGPGITWVAPAEAADAIVTLTDRANPATITVAPGTRVTFANQSGERKRIRSEDGPANSTAGTSKRARAGPSSSMRPGRIPTSTTGTATTPLTTERSP